MTELPERTRVIRVPVRTVDPGQLSLDQVPGPVTEESLQERFLEFHEANPHVYQELVRLARRWKQAGNETCGLKMLFEVLRYREGLRTAGEAFKLNNNYTSRYARLMIEREPELADMFETRELHAP